MFVILSGAKNLIVGVCYRPFAPLRVTQAIIPQYKN
jgi:hypothetical protein